MLGEIRKIISGAVSGFSQATAAGNLFLTAYYDGESEMGCCAFGSIGENLEIELDSIYQFSDTSIPDSTGIAIDTLSKSSFVISYGAATGKSLLVFLEEDGFLSFGSPATFASNGVHEINVLGLREDKFALVYDDASEGKRRGTVLLGSVDEYGAISYSEKFFFENDRPSGISARKLLPWEFIISYNGGWNDWFGYVIKARVEGGKVSFANKVMFNPEPALLSVSPLTPFDGQDFMVIYLNRNTYRGFAKLGTTIKFGRPSPVASFARPAFTIYPNPASDILHIQWSGTDDFRGDISIALMDMSGRIVRSKACHTSQTTFDLGGLQKGLYLIQISDGQGVAIEKVILQ